MLNQDDFIEHTKKLWEHYLHACNKHPFFADSITKPLGKIAKNDQDRKYNAGVVEMWQQMAEYRKNLIPEQPSVHNVLSAELYEIWTALAKRDFAQAHQEIYDAMAVLLRLDENLEELFNTQMENAK